MSERRDENGLQADRFPSGSDAIRGSRSVAATSHVANSGSVTTWIPDTATAWCKEFHQRLKVTDDKVELSGEVASDAEQEKARSIAEANAGRRQVENKIKIKVKGGSEAPPRY
jgi:osmotically-inducible protein OsmY